MIMALDDENFGRIYDYRYSLESAVMEYSSFSAMDQLDALAAQAGAAFQQVRSDVSGVVSYSFDSFETMRPEEVEACYRSLRKAHPALRGVFLATGVSGTLFEALAAEGFSRCRCVAVDRYPGSAAALARGSIDAIVHQNAQLAGRRMIEEFYRILTGEKLSGELLLIEPEILLRHTGRLEE